MVAGHPDRSAGSTPQPSSEAAKTPKPLPVRFKAQLGPILVNTNGSSLNKGTPI